MRRCLLVCAALMFAAPATAKDITVTLNENEQRALIQLIDAAVKATGLQGAEMGVHFTRKIADAQTSANSPEPTPAPQKK